MNLNEQVTEIPGEEYLQSRDLLLKREGKLRHEYEFKSRMSPVAKEAARIVQAIRHEERATLWRDTEDTSSSTKLLYPGMPFYLARNHLHKSRLWAIVSKMPKGSLLHAHTEATIDIDWLLDQAQEIPGYYILSPKPLDSPEARRSGQFRFMYAPQLDADRGTSDPWKSSYVPDEPVPVKRAAELFPGGVAQFRLWATSRMSINPEDSLCHYRGIDAIWSKFTVYYMTVTKLFFTEPIFRAAIPRLLRQFQQDGILYAELRMGFSTPFHRTGALEPDSDFLNLLECFKQAVDNYKSTDYGSKFWGARIIWTAVRRFPRDTIQDRMIECIKSKKVYPDVISGFDFVGQEDLGAPLINLQPLCAWFQEQCRENGVEIPFFFHAGECLGDGDKTDRNLVDAILLGSRRIGHGFSLYKHPVLIDLVKENSILIEICPISHEVLRLTPSTAAHPMSALHARNVPTCLNNDDPALMGHGQNGLSPDFFQVLLGLEAVGLEGLAVMAENSIRWSVFEDETEEKWIKGIRAGGDGEGIKARRVREWLVQFESWCQYIVDNYGQSRLPN